MTLSARAIAMQGFGFAPRFVGLQGFVPVEVPVEAGSRALFGSGGNVGSSSMSLAEWRRGFGSDAVAPGVEPISAGRKKRTKKAREEEFLLLLH